MCFQTKLLSLSFPGVVALRPGGEASLGGADKEEEEEEEPCPPSRGAHVGGVRVEDVHADDALNQPDARGRVLVNVDHPRSEDDAYLAPQLARAVKPHQVTHGNRRRGRKGHRIATLVVLNPDRPWGNEERRQQECSSETVEMKS